jgi:hypothetical protein
VGLPFHSLLRTIVVAVALAAIATACAVVLAADSQAAESTSTPTPVPESPSASQSGAAQIVNYIGGAACMGCHQAAVHDFGATMMGNIILKHPRDDAEKRGCEACHGPGSRYVPEMAKAMGTGKKPDEAMHGPPAEASLTTFRPDSGESAKQDNAACLVCHERGEQAFWRASTHSFREVK